MPTLIYGSVVGVRVPRHRPWASTPPGPPTGRSPPPTDAQNIQLFAATTGDEATDLAEQAGRARAGARGPLSQRRLSTVGRRAAVCRLLTVSAPPVLL